MHMDRTLPLPMAQTRQEPNFSPATAHARGQGDLFSTTIEDDTDHKASPSNQRSDAEISQTERADEDDEAAEEGVEQQDIQPLDQARAAPVASAQSEVAAGFDAISGNGLKDAAQVRTEETVADTNRAGNSSNAQILLADISDIQSQDESLTVLKQRLVTQGRDAPKAVTAGTHSIQHELSSDGKSEEVELRLSNVMKSATDLIFSNSSESGDQSQFHDNSQAQTDTRKQIEHLISVESSQKFLLTQSDPVAHQVSRLKNLANQIVMHASQSEGGDLDINLSPEELGLVKISFSKSDRTTLVIYAERLDTLDLMRRNSELLQKELRESGLSDFNLDFRHNDTSADERGHRSAILTDTALQQGGDQLDGLPDVYLNRLKSLSAISTNTQNIDIRF